MKEAILGVQVYKRDVVLRCRYLRYHSPVSPTRRGKITSFSYRSLRRLRHVLRNATVEWRAFVTLTYPNEYPTDTKLVKSHLNSFLQYLRRKAVKYLWILEYQQRGAPHYHLLLSQRVDKDEISERWYHIVGSEDIRHRQAGTQIKGIKNIKQVYSYLSKYIKKGNQKALPIDYSHSGRYWGTSRGLLHYDLYYKTGHYRSLLRITRPIRSWYKSYLRQYAIKWKWRCINFTTILDGAKVFQSLSRYIEWDNRDAMQPVTA